VLAACHSGNPAAYIPASMAAGGLLTLIIMKRGMQKLQGFKMGREAALKSMLFSLGFAPALLIGRQESLVRGMLVVAVFGLYFLFVQWRLMAAVKAPAGVPASLAETAGLEAESFKGEA
jgi:hypothetical protein